MPASPGRDVGEATIPEVIERIGCGPTQVRFCLTGGGVFFADGAEMLIITAVTTAVAHSWNLSPVERSLAVTTVFIGVLIGNATCGLLSDRYGRRVLIVSSYSGICIFSMLSSFSENYVAFCLLRLCVGFSFGIGQPAWTALSTEITPCKWRIFMSAISMMLFCIGEMFSSILILADDPTLQNLHWRRLLQLSSIPPALFAIASYIFLPSSPSYLALHGKPEDARDVLDMMKKDNRVSSVSTEFQVIEQQDLSTQPLGYQVKEIFNQHYRTSTLITAFSCFGLNVAYYGSLYSFPLILPHLTSSSAGLQLLIGAVWEIPGYVIGIGMGMWLPRKLSIKLYCALTSLSMIAFVAGATMAHSGIADAIIHVGYYGIKMFTNSGFCIVYQYAGEIFPTEIRGTGVAFCIAVGRLGSTIAPPLYELMQNVLGSFAGFFYMMAAIIVLNFFMVGFLPFETSNSLMTDLVQGKDSETAKSYGTAEDTRMQGSPDLEGAGAPERWRLRKH